MRKFPFGVRRQSRPAFRPQVEALEDRLVPSWAGVPPASITPPAYVPVSLNSQGDAQGTASIASTEVDYYSFVARTSGAYRIAALTPSSSLDPVLGLFNSAGTRIAYNDDRASGDYDSDLTVSLTAGRRYYFGITNYSGSGAGSYTWLVNGPAASTDDAFEENDTRGTSANLGTLTASRTISGLAMRDSQDWFRFAMGGAGTASDYVRINFSHSQGDLDLALYNSAGTRIRLSDGVTNTEQVSLNGLAAGTYFIRVYGYNGARNPSYSLTIDPGAGSTPPPPSGNFDIALSFTGLTTSQRAIFNQAAARWEQVITGDLPNASYGGQAVDDLLIGARSVYIDGPGGTLGQAGPDRFRGSGLPYHGMMEFDSADLADMEQDGTLYPVILHEMGHVLGIGTIWDSKNLLAGAGTSNPRFTGARAVAEYNRIFGTSATAVPVEAGGGSGTRDSHWRESVLRTELMTGWVSPAGVSNPLSRITAASLADLGYTVNLAAADPYTAPGAGVQSSSSSSSTSGAGVQASRPSSGLLQALLELTRADRRDGRQPQSSQAANGTAEESAVFETITMLRTEALRQLAGEASHHDLEPECLGLHFLTSWNRE